MVGLCGNEIKMDQKRFGSPGFHSNFRSPKSFLLEEKKGKKKEERGKENNNLNVDQHVGKSVVR